jgi:hypothetical protein
MGLAGYPEALHIWKASASFLAEAFFLKKGFF